MVNTKKSRAEKHFTASSKKSSQFQEGRKHEEQLKLEHTAKLRAMRLAKTAADKEAADKEHEGIKDSPEVVQVDAAAEAAKEASS